MSFLTPPQKTLVNRIGSVVDDVEARMMLGTVGLFAANQQFGVLDGETLYLCVDDESRTDFADAGTEPYRAATVETAAYLAVPDDIVEDHDVLAAWVHRAVEAAD